MFVVALLASGSAYLLADTPSAVGKPTGGGGGATTTTTTKQWNGKNGLELADQTGCDPTQGAYWHWILTAGGQTDVVSATLTVQLATSGDVVAPGYRNGGDNGAVHFDVNSSAPDKVVSASVTFTYTGTLGKVVLTISHATCTDGGSSSASSSTASSSEASSSQASSSQASSSEASSSEASSSEASSSEASSSEASSSEASSSEASSSEASSSEASSSEASSSEASSSEASSSEASSSEASTSIAATSGSTSGAGVAGVATSTHAKPTVPHHSTSSGVEAASAGSASLSGVPFGNTGDFTPVAYESHGLTGMRLLGFVTALFVAALAALGTVSRRTRSGLLAAVESAGRIVVARGSRSRRH
jgi:hypothetical protein